MGSLFGGVCNQCGENFEVHDGGGFSFHLLHCDKCGSDKSVDFDGLGEAHFRYIKGLPGPYAIATSKNDKYIQDNYPGTPLSEDEYHAVVEDVAGACECGGHYKFDAPARCPKCKSTDFRPDPDFGNICYD